jgi:hypothetical protein
MRPKFQLQYHQKKKKKEKKEVPRVGNFIKDRNVVARGMAEPLGS